MNYPGAVMAILVGVLLLAVSATMPGKSFLIGAAGSLAVGLGVLLAFRGGSRPG